MIEMNKIFADRFKSARLMNGFSLQDLSDKLNNAITRQALHKYEKGEVVPDSKMIGLLCNAMNVRPDYFFRENQVELGEVEFRKLKNLPAKEEYRILESAKDYLSRYLELEDLLNIETKFVNPLKGWDPIDSFEKVQRAAEFVREKWNLGSDPIFNAIELLEDNHIKVIYIEAGDGFDGMQTWVLSHDIPVICINESRVKKDDRKRFTAMHELAHLLMPLSPELTDKAKEKLCHQFAASILFPANELRKELGNFRNRISVQELGSLKKQYGISMQAIIALSKDLKIITEAYYKQLFFYFKKMDWRVNEPVEYKGVEESNRFTQLLFRALSEEVISISKAATLNNQKVAEFRQQSLIIE